MLFCRLLRKYDIDRGRQAETHIIFSKATPKTTYWSENQTIIVLFIFSYCSACSKMGQGPWSPLNFVILDLDLYNKGSKKFWMSWCQSWDDHDSQYRPSKLFWPWFDLSKLSRAKVIVPKERPYMNCYSCSIVTIVLLLIVKEL